MTLAELNSHLWNCAEILRGSAVNRTDWSSFILPLLFFKRLSDVWGEETAEASFAQPSETVMDVPRERVPPLREPIARFRAA